MRRTLLALALLVACGPPPGRGPADSLAVTPGKTDPEVSDTDGVLPEVDDRVLDSLLRAVPPRRAVSNVGMGYGMTNWDLTKWCSGPLTATMLNVTPDNIIRLLQLAAKCGTRFVAVPSRPMITTTGAVHSPFSPTRANAFSATLCRVLKPDSIVKYQRQLVGLNLADDYGSPPQWGGKVVTQAQIGSWAAYTRQVCGAALPLGIRVEPAWADRHPEVYTRVDYAWAQWRKTKGLPGPYYEKHVVIAKRLGLNLAMGVNIAECGAQESPPCTPTELRTAGTLAVKHPYNCLSVDWKYDERPSTWTDALRAVHMELLAITKARPWTTCRKA